MGNNQSAALQKISIDYNKWKKIDETQMYDIMENQNQQGQLYHFILNQDKKLSDQIEIYYERVYMKRNFVKVEGIDVINSGIGFCGNQKIMKVMTQRINPLLQNVRSLSPQQSQILLQNSLVGYQELYRKFGPFQINQKMIGLNQNGQIKIWLDQNFGMNTPSTKIAFHVSKHQSQRLMLHSLFQTIQKRTQNGYFREPFKKTIYQQTKFSDAISFLARKRPQNSQPLNRISLNDYNIKHHQVDDHANQHIQQDVVHQSNIPQRNVQVNHNENVIHQNIPVHDGAHQNTSSINARRTLPPVYTNTSHLPNQNVNIGSHNFVNQSPIAPRGSIPMYSPTNVNQSNLKVSFKYSEPQFARSVSPNRIVSYQAHL